jgi:Xaa-Pro aminopeptidase
VSYQLSAVSYQLTTKTSRRAVFLTALLLACAPLALPVAAGPAGTVRAGADTTAAQIAGIPRAEYETRRAALARLVGDGLVIAFGSVEPAADYLEFAQNANFHYLTGIDEPDAMLLMAIRSGTANSMLFVQERDPAREVWVGRRLGVNGAASLTGVLARPVAAFRTTLDSLLAGAGRVSIVSGTDVPDAFLSPAGQLERELRARPAVTITDGNAMLRDLRGRKSATELALIRHAVAITTQAHRAAASVIAPGRHEFELEAALEHTFRAAGAERPAFASIVGSGPNSTVLHYQRNDRRMNAGDLVVIDIGASWRGYAGDVTRTLPVSGRFTPEQRAIYQLVRDAQAAAERVALSGSPASAMNTAAVNALSAGLARLGLIETPDASYDCTATGEQCPQYRLYYMHGLGHAIGLDVHDPGTSGVQPGILAPGDVFSIEPGIYVRRNLLEIIPDTPRNRALKERIRSAVERYADIGVRIEDDYVVTPTGLERISLGPREISEIEAMMRTP